MALVFSGGRENAGDAGKRAKICIREGVGAGDHGVAGFVDIQRAEAAGGGDFALGFRVGEIASKGERFIEGGFLKVQVMNLEIERFLAFFSRNDDQFGVFAEYSIKDQRRWGRRPGYQG